MDLVVKGPKEGAKLVHAVAVAAGGGVGGQVEEPSDGLEGQAFPELEVDDGTLVLGKLAEGGVEGMAEGGLVGVMARLEEAGGLVEQKEAVVGAAAGVATAGVVDELVARGVEEEGAGLAGRGEGRRVFDEPSPQVLEGVPGVGLGAGELEQKREHGVSVLLEDLFQRRHARS